MTLSVIENHDTFKSALTDYQAVLGDIPKILEHYLEYVARTGKPLFSWDMISCLIFKKFENVCEGYLAEKSIPCVRNSTDNVPIEDLKTECLKSLNELAGVPFTIQRMCELLLSPRQNYSRLDKFLRGFIRVTKVVTTVNRVGQRITTESQSFANAMSPFQMNETGDNWLGFSTSYADESDGDVRINSPISDVVCSIVPKSEVDFEDDKMSLTSTVEVVSSTPAQSLSGESPPFSTKPVSLYSSGEPFFLEQKTISMPPIGALFKPIDQLEAFVQTVSPQVESTSGDDSLVPIVSKKRQADDSGDIVSSEEMDDYASPSKRSRIETETEASSSAEAAVSVVTEEASSSVDDMHEPETTSADDNVEPDQSNCDNEEDCEKSLAPVVTATDDAEDQPLDEFQ